MKQGDLYWIDDPNVGNRPVVVLTRSDAVSLLHWIIIAPITSSIRQIPTHVAVGPSNGLLRPCAISLDNMTLVERDRLGRYVGELDTETFNALYEAFHAVFDLPY